MSKYKIKDKKNGKELGVLHVNLAKLSENFRPRFVAGVCFTLMMASTLGVIGEVAYNAQETYKLAQTKKIVEVMEQTALNGSDELIAHVKVEEGITDEVDARIEYLDEQIKELSKDEKILENQQYITLVSEFNSIKESTKNLLDLTGKDSRIGYSDMVLVRDQLREICDSVKDILEMMNKDKTGNGNRNSVVPIDDKKNNFFKSSPRDIFYKEPLNDPPQVFNPSIGKR